MKSNTSTGKMTFRFSQRDANDDTQTYSPTNEEILKTDSVTWSDWQHQASMIIEESETDRVERWIRSSEFEETVSQETVSPMDKHEVEYVMEHDVEYDTKDKYGSMEQAYEQRTWSVHKQRGSSSILKIAGSVVGAIATGLLFGFLALSLIRGEVELPSGEDAIAAIAPVGPNGSNGSVVPIMPTTEDSQSADNANSSQSDKSVTDGQEAAHSHKPAMTVDVKATSVYVLQYGVFAKVDGADKAVAELQQLGLGAVRAEAEGQFRVYAAISDRREDAMLLSEALQSKQISLYVRTLERSAITKLAYEGEAETLNGFMLQSDKVREWLIRQSSQMLQASSQTSFDSQVMDELRKEHLRWTQWGQKMQKQMSKDHEANWLKLVQSMNTAISAVNEYNKKPANAHLWNIQQACIQFMLLENDWLSEMKA